MAARTSSLVPPKYKTKYSVKNWSEYEQGLRNRGDVTIWFGEDAISGWVPRGSRSRGAQRRYSDLAIETALTLGLLFHLPAFILGVFDTWHNRVVSVFMPPSAEPGMRRWNRSAKVFANARGRRRRARLATTA